MNMTTRIKSISWLSCVLAGMAVAPTFASTSFTPFTIVEVTTDEVLLRIGNDDVVVNTFQRDTDPNFAQVGSSPALFAKGRASFGETGSFAVATGQLSSVGAYAESSWSDAFTILGGTGTGILNISVQVEGSLSGTGVPGGPGPNSSYALFASDTTITLGDNYSGTGLLGFTEDGTYTPPDASRTVIGVFEAFSGSNVFTAEIPFTYGTTFYIASYLGAEVLGDGTADFFGSSRFGATAPNGAAVTGASGTAYALAATVPEPSAYAMMAVGLLATLTVTARSRRKREADSDTDR